MEHPCGVRRCRRSDQTKMVKMVKMVTCPTGPSSFDQNDGERPGVSRPVPAQTSRLTPGRSPTPRRMPWRKSVR